MATKELKSKNISPELKAYIAETVYEALHDPDFGMELRPGVKKMLKKASRKNQKWVSFEEIQRKYC